MATEADEYQLEIKNAATLRGGPIANFQGAYVPGNAYRTGDVTEFMSELYLAIADDPVADPAPNPALWRLLGGNGGCREIVVDFSSVFGDSAMEVTPTGMMGGNATYSFTLAQDVTNLRFQVISGGGGGGGTNSTTNATGGGGGSGFLDSVLIPGPVMAGTVYNLEIGAGGTAGSNVADGGAGGTSSVNGGMTSLTVNGGQGGTRGQTGVAGGDGGDGGNGGGGGIVRTINAGSDGGDGLYNGGGAGVRAIDNTGMLNSGAAGTGTNGQNGQLALGGIGGNGGNGLGGRGGSVWWRDSPLGIIFFTGGDGGSSPSPITDADDPTVDSRFGIAARNQVGMVATTPDLPGGGGGGGAGNNILGAAGSPGRVIITYTH